MSGSYFYAPWVPVMRLNLLPKKNSSGCGRVVPNGGDGHLRIVMRNVDGTKVEPMVKRKSKNAKNVETITDIVRKFAPGTILGE